MRLHLTHQALNIRSADTSIPPQLFVCGQEGHAFSNDVASSTSWAALSLSQIIAFILHPYSDCKLYSARGTEGEAEAIRVRTSWIKEC